MSKPQTAKPRKERKENADKRRQQLLDATWRSIAQNGLARTTLATVAAQAELSQGVAVFYFKSKAGLLTEALRDQYQRYQATWEQALEDAGNDPKDRLIALIRADFDPSICNPEALSIWFAFWGEQKFTPDYAAISAQFDAARNDAVRKACAALMQGAPKEDISRIAEWIDTLSDGYWQRMHVLPESYDPKAGLRETLLLVERLVPEMADAARRAVAD
ncbi:TetR family transcriptional regulator C-terminal domain-containing protein [Roseovarius sp. S1116L3]|uniref:TetR family transcriptional regulator C-terminal domain-containing protein n=1 Tax=Roseovarius roseus TaxID=3342636 RepID=UPI00372B71C2